MAVKIDYLLRETGTNLRRNFTLAIASVVTVAVSLSLLGLALVVQKGVDQATQRWQDGVEFIVFMQPDASQAQLDAVSGDLDASPDIASWRFVSQEEAFDEFTEMFPDGEMADLLEPGNLPPSFRVVPADVNADRVGVLADTFEQRPGVKDVQAASEVIRKIESFFRFVRIVVLIAGIALLASSVLLIINTIRMAMFARRREIEVMKLVGATNWFIRLPFMIEGLVQGLIGGLVAVGVVYSGTSWFRGTVGTEEIAILSSFAVDNGYVTFLAILLLAIGTGIGALGSGVAVNRFLDV